MKIYLLKMLVFILLVSCREFTTSPEVETIEELEIGKVSESINSLLDAPISLEFRPIEGSENYDHFETEASFLERGQIKFRLLVSKEGIGSQSLFITTFSNLYILTKPNWLEQDRYNIKNPPQLRVTRIVQMGDILTDSTLQTLNPDGNVIKNEKLNWINNEFTFTGRVVRNQAYVPSGVHFFTDEINYLPISYRDQVGWIDFKVILNNELKISEIEISNVYLERGSTIQ